ncbi:flagellar hook-basal body complex protein [Desulfobacula toluolica]|uniref:Flagellar hook protein FlgE n=1 Tax=Desulfobacula toluolica (strain DSM 7467 / Tol2) TaxID=651182 RepID=K0NLY0_DESTT|nr:flagellar hook-basal body complex protein [Desulfobacula toluolica]CCK81735.1 FlgE: flagellar hook protein [Desulfobacula toluolica Tol2]
MSLSSSLFTGTSGLKNMGNSLQVVGNNISNLNTIGFKKGRSTFADTLYESVATQGGTGQMGRGMSLGSVSQSFSQGSFESTGNATDLSIGGDGFFVVSQPDSDISYYTRAGDFNFDKAGQLVNSQGYVVQGWELDPETGDDVGAIKDILLQTFTSAPQATKEISAITNLDSDSDSNSVVLSNNWDGSEDISIAANNYEYPTVVKVYDALGSTHEVSIYYDKKSGTEWEYIVTCNPEEDKRNSVQGTDSKGLLARGTITFSQSSGDIVDLTMSEFTGRLGNFQANGVNTTEKINYQILNYDEMELDGYGFDFEFDGSDWAFADPANMPDNYPNATIVYSDNQEIHLVLNQADPTQIDPDIIIKLDQPAVATDSFGFDINRENDLHIQGIENTQYVGDTVNDNTTLEINDPSVMTHDSVGLSIVWDAVAGQWSWNNAGVAVGDPPAEYTNAILKGDQDEVMIDLDGSGNDSNDDIRFVFKDSLQNNSEIGFDIIGSTAWSEIPTSDIEKSGYFSFSTDFLGGEYGSTQNDISLDLGTVYKDDNFLNNALSTTQYSRASSTVFQDADGYSAGDFQGVDVSSDGVMTGVYSNGQLVPLFRVGLAKFLNNYGLAAKGGNLFMETRDSGVAITNKPGENGLGTIAPNSLEMSNVDISEEFVSLITNQRGFQANSKTVTTVDAMMETVIQMKR